MGFTGVVENAAAVRAEALAPFAFLGVEVHPGRNAASAPDSRIGACGSPVRVLIVRARGDWAIARSAARCVPSRAWRAFSPGMSQAV
jgi:acetate kinase